MISMEDILYHRVKTLMTQWNEEDIYAVSFYVYSNEAYAYGGFDNVTEFSVSYNTENDCQGAELRSERRWNYAFWRQDESPVISTWEPTEETHQLFNWYKEQGITNIGDEPEDAFCPVGYEELLGLVANVARRLQEEGFLREKFGRTIPIIIHDLEYIPCTIEATRYANPNGEAEDFLAWADWGWEDEEDEVSDAFSGDSAQTLALQEKVVELVRQFRESAGGELSPEELAKKMFTSETFMAQCQDLLLSQLRLQRQTTDEEEV